MASLALGVPIAVDAKLVSPLDGEGQARRKGPSLPFANWLFFGRPYGFSAQSSGFLSVQRLVPSCSVLFDLIATAMRWN